MTDQLYYEDVDEEMELPALRKDPTTQQLVKYAGASRDFYQIHYDKDFALSNGLPGVILQGALRNAFLGHLVTDWIGEHGTLKKLSAQYRGMDPIGATYFVKGTVKKKHVRGGEHIVECELRVESSEGKATTSGYAVVSLPSRQAGP